MTKKLNFSWLTKIQQILKRQPQTRAQLISFLHDAEQQQLLDAQSLTMIEGVLQISEMQARDIMIPRAQMVIVNEHQTLETLLPLVIKSGHSRFPVLNIDYDEVLGVLHAKDLLKFSSEQKQDFELRDIIRPAVVIPESKHLDKLLQEFRLKRNHMAIVVDEYGTIAGFVTIEDVIEQIVGEIEDEFDIEEAAFIKKHSSSEFSVSALTPIGEFNEYFASKFSNSEVDTIGGLVTHKFGHVPKRGESISIDSFQFVVLLADKRRIRLLRVKFAG